MYLSGQGLSWIPADLLLGMSLRYALSWTVGKFQNQRNVTEQANLLPLLEIKLRFYARPNHSYFERYETDNTFSKIFNTMQCALRGTFSSVCQR
jgi:hypothetical protein